MALLYLLALRRALIPNAPPTSRMIAAAMMAIRVIGVFFFAVVSAAIGWKTGPAEDDCWAGGIATGVGGCWIVGIAVGVGGCWVIGGCWIVGIAVSVGGCWVIGGCWAEDGCWVSGIGVGIGGCGAVGGAVVGIGCCCAGIAAPHSGQKAPGLSILFPQLGQNISSSNMNVA